MTSGSMWQRRKTVAVDVGGVQIGGGSPVSVQSMTNTPTHDVGRTLAQVRDLAEAGADLVRVAVPQQEDTAALPAIVAGSPVPIIADVHFHYQRAMEAIEAGVAKIRLNPGNISDRGQVREVIAACKRRGVAIRVGVNEGSVVERRASDKRGQQLARLSEDYSGQMAALMVEALAEYVEVFRSESFDRLVLSVKSSDPRILVDACMGAADRLEFPLHLGLTHAGPLETGRIRSVASLAVLLSQGVGDTLRISYAADPVHEVVDAKELLCSLGLRARAEPDLIACPTCGRTEVDLLGLVQKVRVRLAGIKVPMRVAVMGCIVNGPGEAEGSDVAICAGRGRGVITVQGRQVCTVDEANMLDALHAQCVALADRVVRGEATLLSGVKLDGGGSDG